MNDEQVLVIPAADFERLGRFRGFCADAHRYVPELLAGDSLKYMPRSLAEDDPTHKQLIPYAVLRHGDRVFSYRRGKAGGETRLHAQWSIGVGGHISAADGTAGANAYRNGFERELAEEVHIVGAFQQRIIGLIYDDDAPVGRVHLGIVHLIDLAAPEVMARDPSLADASLRPLAELQSEIAKMESWSAYCLQSGQLEKQ